MGKHTKPVHIPLSRVEEYAEQIARQIQGGEVFGLIGELGSGKTTFTKALGKAMGVRQQISSPTFVMMQQFETPQNLFLYHLDLYRTKNFTEVKGLGITEWWGHPQTVTVIEWADKILDNLPDNTQLIYLHRDPESNQT